MGFGDPFDDASVAILFGDTSVIIVAVVAAPGSVADNFIVTLVVAVFFLCVIVLSFAVPLSDCGVGI